MMHYFSERRMMIRSSCLIFSLYNLMFVLASPAMHLCRPDQRDALWEFKSEFSIQESYSNTTTERWRNNTDCCSWDGVSCDPKTGEVVVLDLGGSYLNGSLRSNSSLFRLQHLRRLDFYFNDLSSGVLPDSIGNLKHLRVLILTACRIGGNIPPSLGNLSSLTELWINGNHFTGELPDSMANLNQLRELQLGANKLSGNFPLMLLNLSALTLIDLGLNQFKGTLPSNMSSLSKLEDFDISGNSFSGSVPPSLFMIPSLVSLDLSRNYFNGPIPRSISKLVGLRSLDLSFWNTERDILDFSIFMHFKSLEILRLSHLNTRSMVDVSLFSSFTLLRDLDFSGNNLKVSSNLHFPSLIESLSLVSCNLFKFPEFLKAQTRLEDLDISANQMEGQVPDWFWRLRLPLLRVNISQNSFSGFEGPADVIQRSEKLGVLDISSNNFEGPFPLLPNSMVVILGSNNRFSGEIPRTICQLVSLLSLDLSNNNFSGSIPQCFNTSLRILNLRNNSLSGILPEEYIGVDLESLDVGHNQLSGKLPKSLINCTRLVFLNLEENRFNDMFPVSLRFLPNLLLLVLRSNELHGPIYSYGVSLGFPKLRIFDISKNSFSGVLPSNYFASWNTMSLVSFVDIVNFRKDDFIFSHIIYPGRPGSVDSVVVTNKGLKMELLGRIFRMYKTIDVSGNKFEGDIPESIGLLKGLIVLNMSNNAFTGRCPVSIVNLTNLESLDLSQNRLFGELPPTLGKLTFLSWMNFSYNRFEGPIPQGTQIQSQNSSSFAENPGLCGAPLEKTCGGGGEEEEPTMQEEDEEKDQLLSWVAAAIGYVPGVLCGVTIGHILTSYKPFWFMRIFHCFT